LGEDGSEALVEERFARRLAEEMGKLRAEMTEKIEGLRVEIYNEIGRLRADIIKWMFIFWVGQFLAIAGLIFTLIRFLS